MQQIKGGGGRLGSASGTLHPHRGLSGACCVYLITQLQKPCARGKVFQREKQLPEQKRLRKTFARLYMSYFSRVHMLQSVQSFSITLNLFCFPANTCEFPFCVGPPGMEKNPMPWKAKGLKPRAALLNRTPSHSVSHSSKELVAAHEASSVFLGRI